MTIFDRNRPSLEAGTTEAVPRQSHAREEKIDARFLTRLQQTIGNRAVANLLARQVPDDYAPLRVGSTATGVKGSKALTWLDKLRGEIGASGVMLATEAFRNSGLLGWILTHEPDLHGKAILARYLGTGGDWVIRGDPRWTHYMQASEQLRAQVLQEFTAQVLLRLRTGAGTHLMFHRFHAETGASGAVPNGYAQAPPPPHASMQGHDGLCGHCAPPSCGSASISSAEELRLMRPHALGRRCRRPLGHDMSPRPVSMSLAATLTSGVPWAPQTLRGSWLCALGRLQLRVVVQRELDGVVESGRR